MVSLVYIEYKSAIWPISQGAFRLRLVIVLSAAGPMGISLVRGKLIVGPDLVAPLWPVIEILVSISVLVLTISGRLDGSGPRE